MAQFFTNHQVAALLREVAAAYTIKKESRFRIAAYEEAAAAIERSTSEVKDLWEEKQLEEIPGVGQNLAVHLDELFRTGSVKHFRQVKAGLPAGMFALLEVAGIGPKTAYKLAKKLQLNDPKTAIQKLQASGELKQFRLKPTLERLLLPQASLLAEKIMAYLKQNKAVEQVKPLGSLRRQTATVGDIDLAVASKLPKEVINFFTHYPEVKQAEGSGENAARVILKNGRSVDLMVVELANFGSLLQHFTGSKQHNIHLRELAKHRGWKLSQYGIEDEKSRLINFASEEEFYRFLGLDWIPPELREDTGEIEAAAQGKLPKLVPLAQIKGDLHLHSNFPIETSHDEGVSSLAEMVKKAISLDYEYLAFTEHNPSRSGHCENDIVKILREKKEAIDQINYSINKFTQKDFRVFNGLEVDIRRDGSLAIDEEALKVLDFVVVSIHQGFNLPEKEMTGRVLQALTHPKAKILGHPTGRKFGVREEVELDWKKILTFCRNEGKFLEVNCQPDRLDLPDLLVREAVKRGVKIVISNDSHEVDDMDLMSFGWRWPVEVGQKKKTC